MEVDDASAQEQSKTVAEVKVECLSKRFVPYY
jgi:hypothetical protein